MKVLALALAHYGTLVQPAAGGVCRLGASTRPSMGTRRSVPALSRIWPRRLWAAARVRFGSLGNIARWRANVRCSA